MNKKDRKKITSFELPIDLALDLTRSGLGSGFSFDHRDGQLRIPILDTQFLGFRAASVIAEPETVLLLGIGMFGLAWFGFGAARPASSPKSKD